MWQTGILNWFSSNKWGGKIRAGLEYVEDGLSGIFVLPIHSNLTLFMENPKSKLASTECGKMPPNKRNVTTTLPSPETDREVYVESLCLQVADYGRPMKHFFNNIPNGQISWINFKVFVVFSAKVSAPILGNMSWWLPCLWFPSFSFFLEINFFFRPNPNISQLLYWP